MPPNPSSPSSGGRRRRRQRSSQSTSRALAHAFSPITHPHHHATTAPTTDVQSSGGNYGIPKANRYKRTRAYKRTSRAVYRSQPARQRKAIVRASKAAKRKSVEQRTALHTHRLWKQAERGRQQGAEALGQVTPHQARVMSSLLRNTSNVFQPFTNPVYRAPKKQNITEGQVKIGGFSAFDPPGLKADVKAGLYKDIKWDPKSQSFKRRNPILLGLAHDWGEVFPKLQHVGGGQVMVTGWTDSKQALGIDTSSVAEPTKGVGALVGQAAVLAGNATHSKILQHGGQDLIDLPAETIPSIYKIAKDTIHDPKKGLKELTDPYKQLFEDPKGSFEKHPIYSLLLAEGARAGVSRAAGGVARTGALGPAAARVARTERAPLAVAGTSIRDVRRYSPDVMVKGAQVGKEALGRRRITKLHADATKLEREGKPNAAQAKRDRAGELEAKPQNRIIKRRVDENRDMVEKQRRKNIADTRHEAGKAVDKELGVAQSLVAQGITKASVEDLKAYRDELKAVHDHGDLSPSQKRMNVSLRAAITDVTAKDLPPAKMREAVGNFHALVSNLEQQLVDSGFLDKAQAARSKLIPYAVRKMGAVHDGESLKVPTKDGGFRTLTDAEIRTHMAKHGHEQPSFVTQQPNLRSAGAYFRNSAEPPSAIRGRRTGRATKTGAFDADPSTLVDQAARMRSLVDQHHGYQAYVGEFAVRAKSGRVRQFTTRKQVDQAVRDMNAVSGVKYRAITMAPFMGKQTVMRNMLEGITPDEAAVRSIPDALHAALSGEGNGPFAIVPEEAALRMSQHVRVLGTGLKALQKYSQMFSRGVLATSPNWALGNVTEAALRSAIARAGPLSYARGLGELRDLKRTDPKAHSELEARAVGGGHFAFRENSRVRRMAEQFHGDHFEGLVRGIETFRKTPGPKQLAGLWDLWTRFAFGSMAKIEQQFQVALLGKYSERLMDPKGRANFRKGIEQAAKGLKGTDEQVAAARWIDRAYGKYSKFGPEQRKAFAMYTPFAAWWLNSFKFFTHVLPVDHPVLLSLMASANEATEEWRKKHNLVMPAFHEDVGSLPGFLQGTIPLSGGRHQRFPTRDTPFGAFNDPTGNVAGLLLPQLSGVQKAFVGTDWKGSELRNADGSKYGFYQKVWYATVQGFVGSFPVFKRIKDTIDNPRKSLDPTYPVQPSNSSGFSSGKRRKRRGGGGGVPIPSIPIPNLPIPGP
jgi:hypothetical protein